MRGRRSRDTKKDTAPRITLLSVVYIIAVAAVGYFLSSLVMRQVDLYELLGLYDIELPLINVPGGDIPPWVLQLVLGTLIFFLLQPFVIVITGLLSRGEQEESYERPFRNPWEH